ncbi:MAG: nuclear transport factor 2 family protein [Actinomycetia bacterium]|nr:nuclear transport factor 2 family protein [Actinomycetes bacterium]MCH9710201.1 nuclear transport factor 2 family protein [Actinomycetes bacterium]MCH9766509.1 nuclear transport factor 2 family protein [Actinomycetes bacterium]
MPSAEHMTQTVNRYLELIGEGRADDVVALYADDATVEDPVGSEVHIGRRAIRGFYANIEALKGRGEILTLRALGHEAAFFWRLVLDPGEGGKTSIEIISIMSFDQEGKISAMKAYWGPENITQL